MYLNQTNIITMNTKKFFMLLAAVLLSSASAIAQSGNNEPLKGDVNEDGTVDVADIAAVIAIIKNNAAPQTTYYYGGQNSGDTYITSSNYTTIATQSAFTTKQVDMTINNYLYVVVPSTKTVEITDPAGNFVTMNFYNSSTGVYAKTQNVATNGYYLIRTRMSAATAEKWTIRVN